MVAPERPAGDTLRRVPALTAPNPTAALTALHEHSGEIGQVAHIERFEGRSGTSVPWPTWVPGDVAVAFAKRGIVRPWSHQAQAANLARAGQHVVLATPAASGKSAAFLAPALTAIAEGGTVLYLAPTKALAADQLAAITALGIAKLSAACVDGDRSAAERAVARSRVNFMLTNPDTLHASILPSHPRWHGFLTKLRLVIVDECHGYSGVFGSHVAHVLRRLRRICRHHRGGEPTFILASATVADPARTARLLTGLDAIPVSDDGSPRAPVTFALLVPRGSAADAAAKMLSRLVSEQVRTLAFARSRREAEMIAIGARKLAPEHADRVAAYRSGYLADDRRKIEAAFRDGTLTGLAATSALELGISVPGLDAVLMTGWPGSWSSLWQQAGRAGRSTDPALAVFIARDDPLDRYLVQHPQTLLRQQTEPVVLDPGNERVLAPHLEAAAAELPLTGPDLDTFGPAADPVAGVLAAAGRLRLRPGGWYSGVRTVDAARTGLRGEDDKPVRVVEDGTGRLIGTIDEPSAQLLAHEGAVYLHQGETYLVRTLDLDAHAALVTGEDPGYTTRAEQVTQLEVTAVDRQAHWGEATAALGDVTVTRQVTGFTRIRVGGWRDLDLPRRTRLTRAVWFTISHDAANILRESGIDVAGAAHATQHAATSLLPLFAACDRADVAGTCGDPHPATGVVSVFVYDGQDGGSGLAERGFAEAARWLSATRDAIAGCECENGCLSCVHSGRCGSGNRSLSKSGAVALLTALLAGA
jgi:DEAD/DEAH box helicase domain-containing protein